MMNLLAMLALLHLPIFYIGEASLTWYDLDTPVAAYHHNQLPVGWPCCPDHERLGVAAPTSVPFGTKVLLVRPDTGQQVVAVVVDRTGDGENWDAYPAVAAALGFGPEYTNDAGRVTVQVYLIERGD